MSVKRPKIPNHIARQYPRGVKGFKSEKRGLVRLMLSDVKDMRCGCAYFPEGGSDLVDSIQKQIEELKRLLTVKVWGK